MPHRLRWTISWTTAALLAALALGLVWRFHHRIFQPKALTLPATPMASEPRLMLWAWETPEDLTTLNPSRAGVAFLAHEILLSDTLTLRPRRQPLRIAPNTFLMAVVRIETGSRFMPTPELRKQSVAAILEVLTGPNVRALQIDFDATASQRDFYAALLRDLRRRLPPGFPLSITALVSWCGEHSWLRSLPSGALPIDEAVPMFFRMGGPIGSRATAPKLSTVTEPLCATSMGLATDETWPAIAPQQRVYLFRPGPWSATDIAKLNANGYQGLR